MTMAAAEQMSTRRSLSLLRLGCAGLIERFAPESNLSVAPEMHEVSEQDLRYLFAQNADSALYLPFDPDAAPQQLYQHLADRQMSLAREVGALFEDARLRWAFVQGVESTSRLFHGAAFARRGDIDILIASSDAARAETILRGIELRQFALSEDGNEAVLVDHDFAAAVTADQYYKKTYPFSRVERLDLPTEVSAAAPSTAPPMFRNARGVFAFLGVEMVTSYTEAIATEDLLETRQVEQGNLTFLDPDINFVITAKRLYDGLLRKEPRLRILCELAVRYARNGCSKRVETLTRRFGVATEFDTVMEMVRCLVEPADEWRATPEMLAEYLSHSVRAFNR